jgi:hypothetical protein
MVMRWRQGHRFEELPGAVVKEPVLVRLKACNDGMTGIAGVMLRVL